MIFLCLFSLILLNLSLWYAHEKTIFFITGVYSLVSMLIYAICGAYDVCMTEVALNTVISTIFLSNFLKVDTKSEFQFTLSKDGYQSIKDGPQSIKDDLQSIKLNILKFLILVILFFVTDSYFEFTDNLNFKSFAVSDINTYYLNNAYKDIGITSVTAAILADYRGFDTFIETLVVLVGSVGILFINKKQHYKNFQN